MASGSDSDWCRLRQAFDALVDLPPAERAAALPWLGLPPAMVARLQRLLDADCTADARLDTQSAMPFAVPAEAPASADDPLPRQLSRYRRGQAGALTRWWGTGMCLRGFRVVREAACSSYAPPGEPWMRARGRLKKGGAVPRAREAVQGSAGIEMAGFMFVPQVAVPG